MEIRAYKPHDLERAKALFEKFYAQAREGRLDFPDMENYLCAFTVLDDNGEIITTG